MKNFWNASVELLNLILDNSPEAIFICDNLGKAVKVNKAYEELCGIKADQILGKTMQEMVDNGYFDTSIGLLVLKTKKPTSIIQLHPVTGKEVMVTAKPILDAKGQVEVVVGVTRDISELNHLKKELEKKREETHKLSHEVKQLRTKLFDSSIIASSKEMENLLDLAVRVAKTQAPILLQGETGTGKEVIANYIHKNSINYKGPFITLNCATLPENLIESELFGYESGAFSGAKKEGKVGLLELANSGTFFLDEVGDLPFALQSKLLRILEEMKVRRLGGIKTDSLNFRLISAANKNLSEMVSAGTFREDLYFRLAIFPITIPPLRKRKEDIIAQTNYFLDFFNKKYQKKKSISSSSMYILTEKAWPGNTRELRNFIERIVVLSEGNIINTEDLSFLELTKTYTHGTTDEIFDNVIEAKEKGIILNAYEKYQSTRKAAEVLGMSQSRFMRKLKKYCT